MMVTVKTTISLPHEVDKPSLSCDRALNAVSKINRSLSLLLVHGRQVPDVTDDGPARHHQVQVLHHWVATAVPESITKIGIILQTGKHMEALYQWVSGSWCITGTSGNTHSVTTWKTSIVYYTAVRTSKLAKKNTHTQSGCNPQHPIKVFHHDFYNNNNNNIY